MDKIEVVLSDLRVAVVRKGKGKDLFKAQQLANTPEEVSKILLVILTTIDGKPATEDDIDELPLEDVMALMNAFSELHPFSQIPERYLYSSGKDSDSQS